jgi:predicted ArsR family transcriptional regulator
MFGQDQPTDLQQDILALYERKPNVTATQIADELDCSSSYVRETVNDYRDPGGLL